MRVRDRVLKAARALGARKAQVSVAEVARAARVSWPTANRHLGGRAGLEALLGVEPRPSALGSSRDRLVAAFGRLVARAGIEGAALDEVSLEAGVTKGSFYWHFDTKAELVDALIASRPVELRPFLELARARASGPALEAHLDAELTAAARDARVRELLAVRRAKTRDALARELGDEDAATIALAILDGLSVARRLDGELDAKRVVRALRTSRRPR